MSEEEEVEEPEEEIPEVKPVEPEEAPEELEEEEEAVPEAPPVEELPNIFVSDSSTPPRDLTGPRILVVVDEKKAYPMDANVNRWVLEHDVPIKVPTPELDAKIKELGVEGQTTLPDLAELTKKLEA